MIKLHTFKAKFSGLELELTCTYNADEGPRNVELTGAILKDNGTSIEQEVLSLFEILDADLDALLENAIREGKAEEI